MNAYNRALCVTLRKYSKPRLTYAQIAKKVKKLDGKRPGVTAVRKTVLNANVKKKQRGRPAGSNCTTTKDDAILVSTLRRLRPPGCGLTAEELRRHLPIRLQHLSLPTIRKRLANKGYIYQKKITKSDPNKAHCKRRMAFARANKHRSPKQWKNHVQGFLDFKIFTYYPKQLKPKHARYRARWTYMTKAEKNQKAFVQPKRWFPRKDYKKTKPVKVS